MAKSHPRGHLAVPPYLQPESRSHSAHSVLSNRSISSNRSSKSNRPHPQNEYIPSTAADIAILGTGEPAFEPDIDPRVYIGEPEELGEEDEEDVTDDEADWDAIRQRDAANKRPYWLFLYVVCTALPIGMSVAPKSELYINLVCLRHPPREKSSVSSISAVSTPGQNGYTHHSVLPTSYDPDVNRHGVYSAERNGLIDTGDVYPNASLPMDPIIGGVVGRTPGDRWFLKLQKDMYEYRLHHSTAPNKHPGSPSPSTTPGDIPSGPLPQPSIPDPSAGSDEPGVPEDTDDGGDDGGNDASKDREGDRGRRNRPPPFRAIDPKMCKKDPEVQAFTAKFIMSMTVTLGILSALTTGFWGKTSDRVGRTRVVAAVEIATFIAEASFLFVASFPYLAPGGYLALFITPISEGLAGGTSTLLAAAHAYLSDITPDDSRAKAFSRLSGVLMIGFATGPLLGSLLVTLTDNIMSPLYINVIAHFILATLLLTVMPESLSKEARLHLKKKSLKEKERRKAKEALQREWEDTEHDPLHDTAQGDSSGWSRISTPQSRTGKRFVGRMRRGGRRLISFLEPLKIFKPVRMDNGKNNRNLALLAFAVALEAMNNGVLAVKAQYMFFSFGWTSTQLGPYMSAAGYLRGFTLVVILPCEYWPGPIVYSSGTVLKPVIMAQMRKWYFRKSSPADIPGSAQSGEDGTVQAGTASEAPTSNVPTNNQIPLDLLTVRMSYVISASCLFLLGSNLPEVAFVIVSLVVTLAAGSGPGLNSLAIAFLPNKSETGRLFGGLAVLHALGTTLLSPILYGELFASTVGIYAPTVFLVAGMMPVIAFVAVCFVQPPKDAADAEVGRRERARSVQAA